jgi:hypothetical protein
LQDEKSQHKEPVPGWQSIKTLHLLNLKCNLQLDDMLAALAIDGQKMSEEIYTCPSQEN